MPDRSVSVLLTANVAGYVAAIQQAKLKTADFAKSAGKNATDHKQSWDKVGKGMLVTGGVIALGVGFAVKAFAEFDKEMSGVRAVSGANAKQMEQLGAAAMKAGADTVFSASEAAKAEAELAKAGVSTADILGGALTGSLNLASAGGLDLANAATIAAQAMNIFKLGGQDVSHIADVLASGANKSAADVGSLGDALKQGGLVAAQTGLHLEDTVGVLSMFADSALVGSDAGTSLKTMLMRLVPDSEKAAGAMEDIGFSAFDASGAFVGMESVAGQLKTGLTGLSDEQRASTLTTIFGSDAVRAASILYEQGAAGVRDYTKAMNDDGAAARMAGIMLDNLSGDFEGLKGSIETGLIGAGSAGNGVLRTLTQTATGAVNAFNNLPVPLQQGAVGLGAVLSAALLAGGAFMTVVPKIAAAKTAMTELGIASRLTRASMITFATSPIGIALGAATIAIGLFAKGQMDAKARSDDLRASLDQTTGAITDQTRVIAAKQLQDAGAFKSATQLGIGVEKVNAAAMGSKPAMDSLVEGSKALEAQYDREMVALDAKRQATGRIDPVMAAAVARTKEQSDESRRLVGVVSEINGVMNPMIEDTKEVATASGTAAKGVDAHADAQSKLKTEVMASKDALDKFVQSLQDSGLIVLSTRDATRQWLQSQVDVTEAIKKNGKTLSNNTQKGRDNAAVLDARASKALGLAKAIYSQTGSEAAMRASLVTSRAALVQTGVRFGLTKKQAEAYAGSIIKIPPVKKTKLEIDKAAAEAKIRTLQAKINAIKAKPLKQPADTAKALRDIAKLQAQIDALRGKSVPVTAVVYGADAVGSLKRYMDGLRDKKVTLTVAQVGGLNKRAGLLAGQADGGPIVGRGGPREDNILIAASSGEYMINAASTAKHRGLVEAINADKFADGGLIGGRVQHLADGGFVAANFSSMRSGMSTGSVPSREDIAAATLRAAKATTALHAAENALYTLRHTKGHTARQISVSEDKLANARTTAATATRALSGAEAARAASTKPFVTQWHASAGAANRQTKRFLDNIGWLRRHGFGVLSEQLLMAGDEEAYKLADAAVKNAGTARALTADVKGSLKNQASLDAARAGVEAKYAVKAPGAAPTPAWSLPVGVAASSYGARPAPGRVQQIIVKIGDKQLTQMISATVDGHTQSLVDGLVYGGNG